MTIKYGCHGSTWELDYDKKSDYFPEIADVVEYAGFQGVDIQVSLLGRFKGDPQALKKELDQRSLQLAALTIPFNWLEPQETEEEKALADYYIEYIKHFPNALLNVAPRTGNLRENLVNRQQNIIRCANQLAKRAHEQGVLCSFHPNSPAGSVFRLKEDYEILFEGLDTNYISYTPDAGHIVFGGMDALEIFKKYLPFIKHVHFKDATKDFQWRKMGTGDIDFPAIVQLLTDSGYDGWIMVEEETEESTANPKQAVVDISKYVNSNLKPISQGVN
ncbi:MULTISPECIES: sugar phosphate isomerase/epimerase [unclassified Planococcus (in: firmicutes)]|uniref:sugar phosphate isomerase/epimerase family protein n=1 Tax=unclassified Planococcus (in: firmicutes) TaxID=2662419 RepID=UPI001F44E899|nr:MULTISPECIES: TIM barrel protein [unclassified Planococcus (in: firmicutes)]UJF26111.1 sugar phosphate isomerase/epimerase [Planococcus sp. 107-1]GKW45272.1 inosose dehydratase [Planococcus sp. NCCP-2050]